jgi:lipopolysaccharide export system permease protein
MLNVFQINAALDSVDKKRVQFQQLFGLQTTRAYLSLNSQILPSKIHDPSLQTLPKVPVKSYSELDASSLRIARTLALSKIRRNQQQLQMQQQNTEALDRETTLYWIEFHRKFALTYSIIVLFFVGAPLGALIKKGGFGAPVVIAALIFMLYFILISIGDNLADTGSISPMLGMWLAAFVFTPVAFLFTRAAILDKKII